MILVIRFYCALFGIILLHFIPDVHVCLHRSRHCYTLLHYSPALCCRTIHDCTAHQLQVSLCYLFFILDTRLGCCSSSFGGLLKFCFHKNWNTTTYTRRCKQHLYVCSRDCIWNYSAIPPISHNNCK